MSCEQSCDFARRNTPEISPESRYQSFFFSFASTSLGLNAGPQGCKRMMSTMLSMRHLGIVFIAVFGCSQVSAQSASEATGHEPRPYLEKDVSLMNAAGHIVLGGTLTRPVEGGPFPAVLLIPGSGPQGRDESVAHHKPFHVLADYLTRRGIAVLRVDRRGVNTSTGDFTKATTEDFASDAEAAVQYLMARPDVDRKRVGLIGHGEGAIIAPMVADKVAEIAFVVLLAPPALPGEQVLLTQRERAERAAHVPEPQIALDKKIAITLYGMVREGKKERDLERALGKEAGLQGELAALWQNQIPRLETPWLRFFLSYDPRPELEKLKCPVLALHGEKDMDVSPDENVPALKAALGHNGNRDVTVKVMPGLNYYLQTAETGLPIEYPAIAEAISPIALETIGAWIGTHTTS